MLRKWDTWALSLSQLDDIQTHIRESQQERACSWGMRECTWGTESRFAYTLHSSLWMKSKNHFGNTDWSLADLPSHPSSCLGSSSVLWRPAFVLTLPKGGGSWPCDRYLNYYLEIELPQKKLHRDKAQVLCNWIWVIEVGHILIAFILSSSITMIVKTTGTLPPLK